MSFTPDIIEGARLRGHSYSAARSAAMCRVLYAEVPGIREALTRPWTLSERTATTLILTVGMPAFRIAMKRIDADGSFIPQEGDDDCPF